MAKISFNININEYKENNKSGFIDHIRNSDEPLNNYERNFIADVLEGVFKTTHGNTQDFDIEKNIYLDVNKIRSMKKPIDLSKISNKDFDSISNEIKIKLRNYKLEHLKELRDMKGVSIKQLLNLDKLNTTITLIESSKELGIDTLFKELVKLQESFKFSYLVGHHPKGNLYNLIKINELLNVYDFSDKKEYYFNAIFVMISKKYKIGLSGDEYDNKHGNVTSDGEAVRHIYSKTKKAMSEYEEITKEALESCSHLLTD